MNNVICVSLHSVGKTLEVERLKHVVTILTIFTDSANCFPKKSANYTLPQIV